MEARALFVVLGSDSRNGHTTSLVRVLQVDEMMLEMGNKEVLMHASGYICIHAGEDLAVDATDVADTAVILQELGELMPRANIATWWLGEFKQTGPCWYRVSNLDAAGPRIGLWLVGQLCARGWEVFQVNYGNPMAYHLRRTP